MRLQQKFMKSAETSRLGIGMTTDFQFVKEHFEHFIGAESWVHDKGGADRPLRRRFMNQKVLQAIKQRCLAGTDRAHGNLKAFA